MARPIKGKILRRVDYLYAAWTQMKQRCLNPNSPRFSCYGGRGVKVHSDWIHSFEAFAQHVGPRPSRAHSLDRIDNDGDYEPGNVRWATRKQQYASRRVHSEKEASKYGKKAWTKRLAKRTPEEAASRVWHSTKYQDLSNTAVLAMDDMYGWTQETAYRRLGKRNLLAGRRRNKD